MKAFVCSGYNFNDPLSTLTLRDNVPLPTITAPSQIMIQVQVASVNPGDYMYIKGIYKYAPFKPEPVFPCPLGIDGIGSVVQVGKAVKKFKTGDVVMGVHANVTHGTFAQYAIFEEAELALVPQSLVDNLSAPVLGAVPLVFLTAFKAFESYSKLAPYATARPSKQSSVLESVVISGASGGIGGMCVLLAKHFFGAKHIIAVCSANNKDYVAALGATQVIDYKSDNVQQAIAKLNPQPELVIDAVGTSFMEQVYPVLTAKSCFVTLVPPYLDSDKVSVWDVGTMMGTIAWKKIMSVVSNSASFTFCGATPDGNTIQQFVQWMQEDDEACTAMKTKFKIETLELKDLPKALEKSMARRVVGKLALKFKNL